MEDNRIIDPLMPHPDENEPIEKEYVVNLWTPVNIQVQAYGCDEEEAIKNAIEMLKNGSVSPKIVDRDYCESEVAEVEEL